MRIPFFTTIPEIIIQALFKFVGLVVVMWHLSEACMNFLSMYTVLLGMPPLSLIFQRLSKALAPQPLVLGM